MSQILNFNYWGYHLQISVVMMFKTNPQLLGHQSQPLWQNWGFPKLGLPPVIIHLNDWDFPWAIKGVPPFSELESPIFPSFSSHSLTSQWHHAARPWHAKISPEPLVGSRLPCVGAEPPCKSQGSMKHGEFMGIFLRRFWDRSMKKSMAQWEYVERSSNIHRKHIMQLPWIVNVTMNRRIIPLSNWFFEAWFASLLSRTT